MLTVAKLGNLIDQPQIHQQIVGSRNVPYALGVTETLSGPAFTLRIADPTGVPEQIVIDDQSIPIITYPFAPAVPYFESVWDK